MRPAAIVEHASLAASGGVRRGVEDILQGDNTPQQRETPIRRTSVQSPRCQASQSHAIAQPRPLPCGGLSVGTAHSQAIRSQQGMSRMRNSWPQVWHVKDGAPSVVPKR
eukprot:CAMPEP_0194557168 /NCGR_PEP_ID=MMETSP0253-20130528/99107_1 /TAXON_ID=2966 /ORGANISM="Noctiluca scintillans" /LENGTH=108 /DNA_ID=CAMNT_0039404669 /DNA_START=890 /DNA_END=1214 /DNA_ORIENTATION=+